MSYDYKFISSLKQLSQEKIDELEKVLIENAKNTKKAFEVGTYAGYVSLLLAGHTGSLTTIDYDQFVSPNIDDHKKLNSMHFIDRYTGSDLVELFDKHFDDSYDLLYIQRDIDAYIIVDRAKKIITKEVVVISYEDDTFKIEKIKPVKKTTKKTTKTPKATTATETAAV